jgi:hypothetical protein
MDLLCGEAVWLLAKIPAFDRTSAWVAIGEIGMNMKQFPSATTRLPGREFVPEKGEQRQARRQHAKRKTDGSGRSFAGALGVPPGAAFFQRCPLRAIAAVSHAMLVTCCYLLKSCQREFHEQPFWTGF